MRECGQELRIRLEVTAKLWLVPLWSYGSTNSAQSWKIFFKSVASHLNSFRLSPIICTWLESPKVALYARSYCKLIACIIVELSQHKICSGKSHPTSRLHSSKTKGVVTPTNWDGLQSPSLLLCFGAGCHLAFILGAPNMVVVTFA